MTKNSKAALLAALMIGTGGLVLSQPAMAKKEEAAAPKLSQAFVKAASAAQTAIAAKNWDAASASLEEAKKLATNDDENLVVNQLGLNLENNKLLAATNGDAAAYQAQRISLLPYVNGLIDNPKTPPADKLKLLDSRADMFYKGKRYKEAIADYEALRAGGNADVNVTLRIAQAKYFLGDVDGMLAEMQKAIVGEKAAGRAVPKEWYDYVIPRLFSANRVKETADWASALVHAYPSPAAWRQWCFTYMKLLGDDAKPDYEKRIDLYRLVRASGGLAGNADYVQYAFAADKLGISSETKAVLSEGRASGKVPASDPDANRLMGIATASFAAEKPFDVQIKAAKASKSGDLSWQTADLLLGAGKYAEAADLYRDALSKPAGPKTARSATPDDINTHLGIALALSGDKAGAASAFKAVTGTPRSEIAKFWLTWLDIGSGSAAAKTAAS